HVRAGLPVFSRDNIIPAAEERNTFCRREIIAADKFLCLFFRNKFAKIRFFFLARPFLRQFYIIIIIVPELDISFLISNSEGVRAHGGETLGKFLVHSLDGSNDTNQR